MLTCYWLYKGYAYEIAFFAMTCLLLLKLSLIKFIQNDISRDVICTDASQSNYAHLLQLNYTEIFNSALH